MSVYLDASVLVALFTDDVLAGRADAFLRTRSPVLIVSDFAAAEFASAIARHVRMRGIRAQDAHRTFTNFDAWIARAAGRALTTSADVASAAAFLRRLDLPLRTPDALNIAIAQRIGAEILTFDDQMAASARALGTAVLVG
ncbi:MAG TPA: type II toxin-antitoxin system VapC family toxin [Pseudomonadota bacterium]|nr:type II toxin-antitoxin system VapC family toxin [Pseudomonadota bacterium]